ncbi:MULTISPECIES: hypothetical protein [Halococcus]|uniref:DUF8006 domain-containing protein n=1 Tax=Halococcus salifodinae DSM 8989 TaxID=1227456 RepID=M0MZH4_9EURY|nr:MULTISPECIES: hypothetical protein [Halococcus]EMA50703.1 hypothetical protein C450_13532 [Halococcus salifodinae DSM 8989]
MFALPLQVIDNFLLQYNLGQVLLLVFVLATLAALTQRSLKIIALQTMTFGLLFMLVPSIDGPGTYLYLGIGLLMIAPMAYVSAGR